MALDSLLLAIFGRRLSDDDKARARTLSEQGSDADGAAFGELLAGSWGILFAGFIARKARLVADLLNGRKKPEGGEA